ncbi:hypothetical protein K469DRAFT_750430 [Zopfia rhizophila CBS 207.26]|uniref:Uncharacterized protein n=1 Tax=Zopfia rhizophila CBS 207.26 TaxID=1314779 RepID=A0A6A6DZZ9_9PEZI|nr:hypothetical protein K469DRAFT_750430 [Zopfia rhizophila CBS 207.26]
MLAKTIAFSLLASVAVAAPANSINERATQAATIASMNQLCDTVVANLQPEGYYVSETSITESKSVEGGETQACTATYECDTYPETMTGAKLNEWFDMGRSQWTATTAGNNTWEGSCPLKAYKCSIGVQQQMGTNLKLAQDVGGPVAVPSK